MTALERPHGPARYRFDGCLCSVCRQETSAYRRRRAMGIATGTWRPYVPAVEARDHLQRLSAAGIGYRRVAELAGLGPRAIPSILYGRPGTKPKRLARAHVVERILAVPVAPLLLAEDDSYIDATGTARRAQALCCMGWSTAAQADLMGIARRRMYPLVRHLKTTVLAARARAVRDLYDRISMTPSTRPDAGQAREYARGYRWFGPLDWDDESIDDPDAYPILLPPPPGERTHPDELAIQHIVAGHVVALTPALRGEIVRRSALAGWPATSTAEALNTTAPSVRHSRSRLRRVGLLPAGHAGRPVESEAA